MQVQAISPFEYISQHVQLVGWGSVLFGVWQASRLLSRVRSLVEEKSKQFDEVHAAITNHFSRVPELLETQTKQLAELNLSMKMHDEHENGHFETLTAWIAALKK